MLGLFSWPPQKNLKRITWQPYLFSVLVVAELPDADLVAEGALDVSVAVPEVQQEQMKSSLKIFAELISSSDSRDSFEIHLVAFWYLLLIS